MGRTLVRTQSTTSAMLEPGVKTAATPIAAVAPDPPLE